MAGVATAIVAAVAMVLPLLGQAPAVATSQAQVEAQINDLGNKIAVLDEQYNEATIHLQNVQNQIADSRSASAKAEASRAQVVQIATQQAIAIYKQGAPSVLASFLTSKNLAQFNQRMELLSQVGTWESGIMNQLQIADQRSQQATDQLNTQLTQAKTLSTQLATERSNLSSQLDSENRLLSQINAATKAAEERAAAARAAAAQAELTAEMNAQAAREHQSQAIQPSQQNPANPQNPGKTSSGGAALPALPASGGASAAIQMAMSQIGKPYVWAGAGPATYDCSGLTMVAWRAAGVSLPHSAAGQYAMLPHVSRSQLQPGDLVFFGSPIHHVGMYVGGGNMVDAPETGENVQVQPIMSDYVGAARPGV